MTNSPFLYTAGEAKPGRAGRDPPIPANKRKSTSPAPERIKHGRAGNWRDIPRPRVTIWSAVCMPQADPSKVTNASRLPSIRLVQENEKVAVTRLIPTLGDTVPLWKPRLRSGPIQRSAEAPLAVRDATI